ncbi:uncharacterized protein BROUX77_003507 [Berkeleyomyces rouxiae]|uniref:uncharacterized protein n=1 Tax=Berkeleyomyces rouxiae TaxID=2035830 RepID=UPI003B7ECE3E
MQWPTSNLRNDRSEEIAYHEPYAPTPFGFPPDMNFQDPLAQFLPYGQLAMPFQAVQEQAFNSQFLSNTSFGQADQPAGFPPLPVNAFPDQPQPQPVYMMPQFGGQTMSPEQFQGSSFYPQPLNHSFAAPTQQIPAYAPPPQTPAYAPLPQSVPVYDNSQQAMFSGFENQASPGLLQQPSGFPQFQLDGTPIEFPLDESFVQFPMGNSAIRFPMDFSSPPFPQQDNPFSDFSQNESFLQGQSRIFTPQEPLQEVSPTPPRNCSFHVPPATCPTPTRHLDPFFSRSQGPSPERSPPTQRILLFRNGSSATHDLGPAQQSSSAQPREQKQPIVYEFASPIIAPPAPSRLAIAHSVPSPPPPQRARPVVPPQASQSAGSRQPQQSPSSPPPELPPAVPELPPALPESLPQNPAPQSPQQGPVLPPLCPRLPAQPPNLGTPSHSLQPQTLGLQLQLPPLQPQPPSLPANPTAVAGPSRPAPSALRRRKRTSRPIRLPRGVMAIAAILAKAEDKNEPRFTLFSKLPFEIRWMIWEAAAEPRVVKVPRCIDLSPRTPGIVHATRESRRCSGYVKAFRRALHATGKGTAPIIYTWVNFEKDTISFGDPMATWGMREASQIRHFQLHASCHMPVRNTDLLSLKDKFPRLQTLDWHTKKKSSMLEELQWALKHLNCKSIRIHGRSGTTTLHNVRTKIHHDFIRKEIARTSCSGENWAREYFISVTSNRPNAARAAKAAGKMAGILMRNPRWQMPLYRAFEAWEEHWGTLLEIREEYLKEKAEAAARRALLE